MSCLTKSVFLKLYLHRNNFCVLNMSNTVLDPGDIEVNKMRYLIFRYSQSTGEKRCGSRITVQYDNCQNRDGKRESDYFCGKTS